jgi:hypothetical protein
MNISIHRVASITQFTNAIKREDGTTFHTKTLRVEDNKGVWYEIVLVSDDKESLEIK